ncbi:MAG: hypothetical protein RSB77_05745 [Bacilli bacterium]
MIFKDMFKALIKDKNLNLILVFQLSLSFIFINLIVQNISTIQNGYKDIASKEKNEINYQIVDQLHQSTDLEQSIFRDKKYFPKLRQFYTDLTNSKNFNYYENIDQQLYVKDFNGDDKFYNDYKYTENVHENGDVIVNGEKLSGIKNKILSKSVMDKYKFKVSSGKALELNDFNMDNLNQKIPVLLGNDFKKFYSVGDEIEGELHYKKFIFKVVGVLEENTYINQIGADGIEYLDTYIITPSINISKTINLDSEDDVLFANFFYLQKTNGIVGLQENYKLSDFISELESLVMKNDMFEYQVNDIFKVNTDFIKLSSKESIKLITSTGIIMTIFSTITVSLACMCKFIRNRYNYGVLLTLGYSKVYVTMDILGQLLVLCIASNIIAYILTTFLSNQYISYSIINVILSMFIIIIGGVIPSKIIADTDIISMIKEKS